jgi:hypothetical protein
MSKEIPVDGNHSFTKAEIDAIEAAKNMPLRPVTEEYLEILGYYNAPPAQQTQISDEVREAMVEAVNALKALTGVSARIPSYVPDDAMVVLTNLAGGIIDTTNEVSVGDLRSVSPALAKLRSVMK